MERDRIINFGSDPFLFERPHEGISLFDSKHELIINVVVLGSRFSIDWGGQPNFSFLYQSALLEEGLIPLCIFLAPPGPIVQVIQLHIEHCRLDRVEPEIAADHLVVVLRLASMDAQHFYTLSQFLITRDYHPTIAQGAQVLAGEKGEAPDRSYAAGPPSITIL